VKIPPTSEQSPIFKENEDLYKRLNKSLEHKIASKEDEIKNIDKLYDKKIEQAKLEGESDYMQNLDRNQQRIMGETNAYEEKMKGYQERLQKTHDTVAQEEASIKTTQKDKLDSLKTELERNFQDQYANLQEDRREIQESTRNAVKEISTKSKSEKSLIQQNSQFEMNALASSYNQKAADSESSFRSKLDQDVRLHNAEIAQQKDELKKLSDVDMEKNKRLSSEKNRVAQDQLTYQSKHQEEMLKQRDADFKVRYERIVQDHNKILKDLSDHLESDIKKIVDSNSSKKKVIEERIHDPFYQVDKLEPKMYEELKTVTVALPVAEYEKENVHLSTQGRNIKITLSRKYSDNLNDENGGINRSTRSELYSKEFNTKDLLSSKDITQSYEDGLLTFKIKKA
jgi:HSP20 family molecular chaperone IbpA